MADEKKKKKRPTAEKRMKQDEKKREKNKAEKSRIRTAVRRFEESLNSGDEAAVKETLKEVYSLVDKAVKKGIYKLNKASRIKSRLSAKSFART